MLIFRKKCLSKCQHLPLKSSLWRSMRCKSSSGLQKASSQAWMFWCFSTQKLINASLKKTLVVLQTVTVTLVLIWSSTKKMKAFLFFINTQHKKKSIGSRLTCLQCTFAMPVLNMPRTSNSIYNHCFPKQWQILYRYDIIWYMLSLCQSHIIYCLLLYFSH